MWIFSLMLRPVLASFLMSFLIFSNGYAKDLYVAPTGDDSVSYDINSIEAPWGSPERAWYNALAGDIVYFRGGTYTITTQVKTKYNGNNGTESAPILFTSYPGEQAVFSASGLTGDMGWGGSVFSIQKNYNHVSNINFIGSAATWFQLGQDLPAEHFEIRNCDVKLGSGGDNTGFVLSSSISDYLVVENCTIEGPGQAVHLNTSCIYIGGTDYLTVKNNTMHNAPIGIYFKMNNDENSGNEIAYNFIYNTSRNSIQTNSQYTNFHDNIIGKDCGIFSINESNGFALGDNNIVNHNTIMSGGLVLGYKDGGAINNIISNNIISSYTSCCTGNVWDYNMYISGAQIGANDISNKTPEFTTTDQAVPSDFVLNQTSVGFQAGSDGEDIGVVDGQSVGATSIGDLPVEPEKPQPVQDFNLGKVETSDPNRLAAECSDNLSLHPEWIFCDDFEDEAPLVADGRYFEYNDDSGDFIRKVGVGVDMSGGMQATWQLAEVDAGGLALAFGQNPSSYMNKNIYSDERFTEIYYRMYMKNQQGWEGSPYKLSRVSVVSAGDWSQAMIAHTWASNDGSKTLAMDPASCVDSDGNVRCSGWNDFNSLQWLGKKAGESPIFDTGQAGQWKCIEVHVKLNDPGQNNGVQEFWVDDVLQASSESLNFVGIYTEFGLNYLSFENYWNNGSPKEQTRYFDNIVVSTARIGCS